MDYCCVTLKANTHLAKSRKGGLSNGDNGFWGERIKGSLNNSVWVNQLAKSLKTEKKVRKIKPGVAFSVLTSDNAKETVTFQAPLFERRRADPKNVSFNHIGGRRWDSTLSSYL